jgi:hypothetical protein
VDDGAVLPLLERLVRPRAVVVRHPPRAAPLLRVPMPPIPSAACAVLALGGGGEGGGGLVAGPLVHAAGDRRRRRRLDWKEEGFDSIRFDSARLGRRSVGSASASVSNRDGSRARRARVVTTHTHAHEVIYARGHTRYYMMGKEHYSCPLPAGAMCPRVCPFTRHKLTVQHFNHKSPQAERHYRNLKKGYSCTKFNNTSITSSSILDGGIYTNLTEGPHISWFLRVNGRSGPVPVCPLGIGFDPIKNPRVLNGEQTQLY